MIPRTTSLLKNGSESWFVFVRRAGGLHVHARRHQQRRRRQRQSLFPRAQLRGDREPAADGITRERDAPGADPLIEQ